MRLPSPVRRLRDYWKRLKRKRTRKAIHDGLDRAHRSASRIDFSVADDPVIILSDQHKGARDGADDFQRCERSYNAALTYYNRLGYRLVLLGDVEELWENKFSEVVACYPRTLELEAAFHRDGRYLRLWGNHDLAWSDKDLFQRCMAGHGVGDVTPVEAVRLQLHGLSGPRELFLVHGHQGTANSDRHAKLSQFFVRHGWRRLQRHLNRPWNTPSVDWELRGEHSEDMARWAEEHGQVMIAGHTHQPVFFGARKEPAMTPEQVEAPAEEPDPAKREALQLARRQWAEAEEVRLQRQAPIDLKKPWYFNTGCCSFGDGDITGIEISGGKIRLVRWPCDPDVEEQTLGQPLELEQVFALTKSDGR